MRRPKWREGRLIKTYWLGKASLKRWHCGRKGSREATHGKARGCHSGGRNRMRLWSGETLALQRVWKAKLAQMMRCLVGQKGFLGWGVLILFSGHWKPQRVFRILISGFIAYSQDLEMTLWYSLSDTILKWLWLNLLLDTTKNSPAPSSLASKPLKSSIAPLGFPDSCGERSPQGKPVPSEKPEASSTDGHGKAQHKFQALQEACTRLTCPEKYL